MDKKKKTSRKFRPRGHKTTTREIFDRVYNVYLQFQAVTGTVSCAPIYARMPLEAASIGFRPIATPITTSDFIADVELAVKRRMTREIYESWMAGDEPKDAIKETLGLEFKRRKLYPTHKYMKSKTVKRYE